MALEITQRQVVNVIERSWVGSQLSFREAAEWFVEVTGSCEGQGDLRGLGEWTIRDLVGHTNRALLTVETYLDRPCPSVEVRSASEYFGTALAATGDPAAVAQRGRDAGAALGTGIVTSVSRLAERVLTRIEAGGPDAVIATPAGGMYLADYLPTRTFELTVHTCDLAVAVGRPVDVPGGAAAEALGLLGELAVRGGQAGQLLLAATGHRGLPGGFTVL